MALGTPFTALCAPGAPAATVASAIRTAFMPLARRRTAVRRRKNIIADSFRVGALGRWRPRFGGLGRRRLGCGFAGGLNGCWHGIRTIHDQVHHHMALESNEGSL